jgi:hypothetical protein
MMSRGSRIVQCLHCGKDYISGDAVTMRCPDCLAKGHTVGIGPCRVCEEEDRKRSYVDRLRAAHFTEQEIARIVGILFE